MDALEFGSRGLVRPRVHAPQLTPRDVDIVRWIVRHGVVSLDHVGARFFWRPESRTYGRSAAYHCLQRLTQLGLVISRQPDGYRRSVIRATSRGAQLANVGLRPAPLVPRELNHTLALVTLAEFLLYENPGAELRTERELRAQRYRDIARGARPPRGSGRIPDAILRLPSPGARGPTYRTVAIELDLSRKDHATWEHIISAYRFDKEVDQVWWYVTPGRIERARLIVARCEAADRIEVRACSFRPLGAPPAA
jgi:hypothetical protein